MNSNPIFSSLKNVYKNNDIMILRHNKRTGKVVLVYKYNQTFIRTTLPANYDEKATPLELLATIRNTFLFDFANIDRQVAVSPLKS